ncbi:hypothetical protein ASF24_14085 [Methylobacterium sp. Leaf86]|uniref:hypothetical protein n=1 Tax=Methylobacterium sp. Leaf86 TaxID=1736242 RepID=UPI0006FBD364|nr:hypothetical protein [Methylobacterium sp. Leaf86]KQO58992.1 hypothetical protein ASF24_14085 [Methylobacterium sp. Leaf86]
MRNVEFRTTYAAGLQSGLTVQSADVLIVLGIFPIDVNTSLEGAVAVLCSVVVPIADRGVLGREER